MVHPDHPNIESGMLKNLSTPGSAFAITFLFLVFQYTFKLDFQCPCDPSNNTVFCVLYIVFPVIIIFCILILTAKTSTAVCLGTWKYNCKHNFCKWQGSCCDPRSPTCCYIFKHIMRNVVLSCLWIITVLIDGDVFVCLGLTEVNITSWHNQIPCKEKEKLTTDEYNNLKHHQTVSEIIGLSFLFTIPLVWCIFSLGFQYHKNPYKNLYEDLYEDKAITLAEMSLQERAKKCAEDNYFCITELSDLNNLSTYSKGVITLLDEATTTSVLPSINSALTSITSKISSITLEFSLIKLGQSLPTSEPFSTIPNFASITSKLILITSELTLLNTALSNKTSADSPTPADSSRTPAVPSSSPGEHSTSPADPSSTPDPSRTPADPFTTSAASSTSSDYLTFSTISETTSALTSITCKLTSIISGLASIISAPSLITTQLPFTTSAFNSITSELSSITSDLTSITSKLSSITSLPSLDISLTISALSSITINLSSFTSDLSKFTLELKNLNCSAPSSTTTASTSRTNYFSQKTQILFSRISTFFSKNREPSSVVSEQLPLLQKR